VAHNRDHWRSVVNAVVNPRIFLIPFLRLAPHADEMIGDNQCGFRRDRSMTDQILYIRHTLEKNGSIMLQYISCS
jgi:hypothetical protein